MKPSRWRPDQSRGGYGIVLGLFFLSGASGLADEVAWTRMLAGVFGSTASASAVVLATFMAGLAAGAALLSRPWAQRRPPLQTYALLEAGLGLTALVATWGIGAITPLYARLAGQVSEESLLGEAALSGVRVLFAASVLGAPTLLMGGTLPVLVRCAGGIGAAASRWAGTLYAINTLGALAGTAAAGFFLIEHLGMRSTVMAASAANLVCFAGALGLHALRRRGSAGGPGPSPVPSPRARKPSRSGPGRAAPARATAARVMVVAALSGAAALSYEVIWTQELRLITYSTTHAFTVMLMAFLGGLALGSAVASAWALPRRHPLPALALLQGLIAVHGATLWWWLAHLAERFYDLQQQAVSSGADWTWYVALQALLSLAVMLPPTLLMGASFPVACAAVVSAGRVIGASGEGLSRDPDSRMIGQLYALNTVGAVVGALVAGLIGLSRFGMALTLAGTVGLNAMAALIAWRARALAAPGVSPAFHRTGAAVLAVVSLAAVTAAALSDPSFRHLREGPNESIVFTHESAQGRVEVIAYRVTGTRRLITDRLHAEGSDAPEDVFYQRKQGYLPLLLHPRPGHVLEIGLGTGIGLAALRDARVRSADITEIHPGVIAASSFFSAYQAGALEDRRVHLLRRDGRNHIVITRQRYDVIVQGLLTPYHAGIAELYTGEHFQRCRERLGAGGTAVLWIALRQLGPDDLRAIIRTFLSVFPVSSFWSKGEYLGVIGETGPRFEVDVDALEARLRAPSVAGDLARLGLNDPVALLDSFLCGPAKAASLAGEGPLILEDRPVLEFSVPRKAALLNSAELSGRNLELLNRYQEPLMPFLTGAGKEALERPLERAFRARSLALQAYVARGQGKHEDALELLELALRIRPGEPMAAFAAGSYLRQMARQLAARGEVEQASEALRRAVRLNPFGVAARLELAALRDTLGDPGAARALRESASAIRARLGR